jgi:hypothetical protein
VGVHDCCRVVCGVKKVMNNYEEIASLTFVQKQKKYSSRSSAD